MPEINPMTCRGVWAAIEPGHVHTLDDLQLITGIDSEEIGPYVDVLWRQRYVRLASVRRAASGEAICAFRLERHTGPQAPFIDVSGQFVDPNVIGTQPKGRRWGTFPTVMARIRVAAERLCAVQENVGQAFQPARSEVTGWKACPTGFTRGDLEIALGLNSATERHEFQKCWWRLKKEGGLQAMDGDRFTYELSAASTAVRHFFRGHTGRDIRSHEVRIAGRGPVGAALKRQTLDLLAAEGCRVSIRPPQFAGDDTIYRVDRPDEKGK